MKLASSLLLSTSWAELMKCKQTCSEKTHKNVKFYMQGVNFSTFVSMQLNVKLRVINYISVLSPHRSVSWLQ